MSDMQVDVERDDRDVYVDSEEFVLEEPAVELDVNKFKKDVDENFAKIQVKFVSSPLKKDGPSRLLTSRFFSSR